MADPPRSHDTGVGPDRRPTTGTPRWVKVFAIVASLVLLLLIVLFTIGGGPGAHGPRRHAPPGGLDQTPPPGVTQAHAPPGGDRIG
jgi:hypothetical protein